MWVNFLVTLHSDTMEAMARNSDLSPYLDFDRDTWRGLRNSMPQVLTEAEVKKLAGMGENMILEGVADVYLPLSRLIQMQVAARQALAQATEEFLGIPPSHVAYVL